MTEYQCITIVAVASVNSRDGRSQSAFQMDLHGAPHYPYSQQSRQMVSCTVAAGRLRRSGVSVK